LPTTQISTNQPSRRDKSARLSDKETESKLDLVAKDLTNLIDSANVPTSACIDQKGRDFISWFYL
jgi:hypothetical protein